MSSILGANPKALGETRFNALRKCIGRGKNFPYNGIESASYLEEDNLASSNPSSMQALKRWAIVCVLAIAAVFLWKPARQLWVELAPKPVLTLSPLFICTGVDSNGAPKGVSDSYSQEEVADTGLIAYFTYSGALPQKTTYQIRWIIDGRTQDLPTHTFESASDSLPLSLGKNLPPGNHKIELLIDGEAQREASMVIEAEATPEEKSVQRAEKRSSSPGRPKSESPRKKITILFAEPPPVPVAAQPQKPASAAEAKPPSIRPPAIQEEPARPKAPVASNVIQYKVKHRHRIGDCYGTLELRPRSIEFTSDQHTFKFDRANVDIRGNGIADPTGKSWTFFIEGTNVEFLLRQWKNGELFPGQATREEPKAPSPKASSPSATRTLTAKHKHLLGGCIGELQLTPGSLEFSSEEHRFKHARDDVQIDGNGILDRAGNVWRFEIPGVDADELLHSWKTGNLFQKTKP